jgi:SAM-dependent methyltransferase
VLERDSLGRLSYWASHAEPIQFEAGDSGAPAATTSGGRAAHGGGPIGQGAAAKLPFTDASFDVVVAHDALCGADDPAALVGEIVRVLRPGGEFRFYERDLRRGWFQRLAQLVGSGATISALLSYRPTINVVRLTVAAGLRPQRVKHLRVGAEFLDTPGIWGTALRPLPPDGEVVSAADT